MNLFKAYVVKEVQGEVKFGIENINISELSNFNKSSLFIYQL